MSTSALEKFITTVKLPFLSHHTFPTNIIDKSIFNSIFYFQHKNQLSPGRECSDIDMEPQASQSQDCEPTPPLQRHGSKSNFFLPPIDGMNAMGQNNGDSPRHIRMYQQPRYSPHPRQR